MQRVRSFMRWLTVAFPVTLALAWVSAAFAAPPAHVSLSPGSATAGGASFTLTINGKDFTPASTSAWGATALTTTYKSATQLTAVVPASLISSEGTARVTVTTAGGATSGAVFIIKPSIISTATPAMAVASLAPTLSIRDANFTSISTRGATAQASTYKSTAQRATALPTSPDATAIAAASDDALTDTPAPPATTAPATTYKGVTQLTAAVHANLVNTVNGTFPGVSLVVNPPLPTITSLSPSRIIAGNGAFAMNVYGTNFASPTVVNWGTTPLVTIRTGGSTLLAQVPANLVATVGTASVTVTTAGGTSAPASFTIAPPSPAIASLSPSSAAAGGPAFTLTINGANFVRDMEILWGSTWVASTYVSATQVTTTIPASLIATAAEDGVVLYAPGIGWSNTAYFTINPAPPTITSLGPASGAAGGAGFMLTINGTAFTPGATSMWGTTPLGTIYVNPTQLTAAVPASLIVNSGTGSVTVTTAAGTSVPATFTINPSPPEINGLSPAVATAGGAAFTLTISGQYFTPVSIAKWGSTALATTYISQTQLMAAIPATLIAAAGTASITVSTAAGTSAQVTFTINPALRITTTTMPAGTAGNAYSGPINVTGGSPGYTWIVTGLPAGLSFSNTFDSTLTITGAPASSGPITFQVSVQDTTGASAGPVTYTINIAAGPSGVNNSNLNGSYVCLFQGSIDTDGTRWASLASFQADGQGNFNSGIFDTNSYDIGSASGVMTGSYSVGSDNNGMASIHTILTNGAAGIQTTQWAIALSSAAQPARQFRMIEADDLGTLPSYQQGSANCYLATTSAFADSAISGNSFAFGLDGEDNSGNMKAAVGLFSASVGKITNGNIDVAQGGNATVQTYAFTATYSAPDPASGRFTMTLTGAGNSTGFTVYIIDANRMFILDNTSNDGEQAGNMRTQQQAPYSGASITGPFVLYMRGAEFNSGGSAPSGFYSHLFQGTGDGSGNMTINQSYANDAGVYSASNSNGGLAALAFDSAHPGRATFPSAGGTTWLYLFNAGSAFEMSVGDNGSLDSGWLEPQTAPQTPSGFTSAALAGNYLFGNLALLNIEPNSSVGVLGVTAGGVINAALTTTSRGILSWDQSTSMTYSWDATAPGTGTFLIANGAQGEASCAVINATKFVCTPQADSAPSVEVIEQ